jgi:hypothetical protein
MHVAYADPVRAIERDPGRRVSPEGVVNRLCRLLVGAWLRSIERQTEAALRRFEHPGVLEDFQMSRRDRSCH